MASLSKTWIYGAAGLACLGLAVSYHVWQRDKTDAAVPEGGKASAPKATPSSSPVAVPRKSAPAPAYTQPEALATAKSLEHSPRSPAMAAKRKDLDAKIAQGDAAVPEILKGCLEHLHERNRLVDAVVVLRGIHTPEAEKALATLCKKSGIANMTNTQLSRRDSK